MTLRILAVTGTLLETQARAVTVPAQDGSLGILPGHAPMIAALGPGTVRYSREEGGEQTLSITGGILEVRDDTVTILTDG